MNYLKNKNFIFVFLKVFYDTLIVKGIIRILYFNILHNHNIQVAFLFYLSYTLIAGMIISLSHAIFHNLIALPTG